MHLYLWQVTHMSQRRNNSLNWHIYVKSLELNSILRRNINHHLHNLWQFVKKWFLTESESFRGFPMLLNCRPPLKVLEKNASSFITVGFRILSQPLWNRCDAAKVRLMKWNKYKKNPTCFHSFYRWLVERQKSLWLLLDVAVAR